MRSMADSSNQPEHDQSPGETSPKIEIYSTRYCGYCVRAKQLLQARGLPFVEYFVDANPQARLLMMERADGRRSVPQIFINDRAIGGFIELYQLDKSGELARLVEDENSSD